jgi:hypothetical protein
MAEEKPEGDFSGSDQGSEVSSATAPEADVSQYSTEDKAPIPRVPNSALLVLSWGVFSIGLYFLYAAGMGYYEDNVIEAKLAVTLLLAVLTIPSGIFLRKAAYHGFRTAFKEALSTPPNHSG